VDELIVALSHCRRQRFVFGFGCVYLVDTLGGSGDKAGELFYCSMWWFEHFIEFTQLLAGIPSFLTVIPQPGGR
jgi:hypothetical protein